MPPHRVRAPMRATQPAQLEAPAGGRAYAEAHATVLVWAPRNLSTSAPERPRSQVERRQQSPRPDSDPRTSEVQAGAGPGRGRQGGLRSTTKWANGVAVGRQRDEPSTGRTPCSPSRTPAASPAASQCARGRHAAATPREAPPPREPHAVSLMNCSWTEIRLATLLPPAIIIGARPAPPSPCQPPRRRTATPGLTSP